MSESVDRSQPDIWQARDDQRIQPIAIDLFVALGDGGLILAWLQGRIDTTEALIAHAILVSVSVGAVALTRARLDVQLAGCLLMLLVVGPLAGPTALLQRATKPAGCWRSVLDDPSVRADPSERGTSRSEAIFAAIRQGRRPDPRGTLLRPFAEAFADGTLAEQNAAIAAIARGYRAELYPALVTALDARIPAIRVQAAAVYANLRDQFGARARQLVLRCSAPPPDPAAAVALARACREVARSGLLDRSVVEGLEARACAIESCRPMSAGAATRASDCGTGPRPGGTRPIATDPAESPRCRAIGANACGVA